MVSKEGKLLLKNTIQSLEYQNKIKEEKEMWNKWQNERHGSRDKCETTSKRRHDFGHSCDKRHSDEDNDKYVSKRCKRDQKPNNYWLKKLMAEEEKMSDNRWTHNGFKELYSHELTSNSGDNTSSESSDKEVIKKKTKKRKKKQKHKKNEKKHKKKHKK